MSSTEVTTLETNMFFDKETSIKDLPVQPSDFYLVEHPDERFNNPDHHFAHEFKKIQQRRNLYSFKSSRQGPKNLVGLALSSGGQRFADFQLGLLSGLSKVPFLWFPCTSVGKSLTFP